MLRCNECSAALRTRQQVRGGIRAGGAFQALRQRGARIVNWHIEVVAQPTSSDGLRLACEKALHLLRDLRHR